MSIMQLCKCPSTIVAYEGYVKKKHKVLHIIKCNALARRLLRPSFVFLNQSLCNCVPSHSSNAGTKSCSSHVHLFMLVNVVAVI